MLQTLWKKSSERVAKKLSRREHYCCGERLRVSCGGVAFFSVPTAANIPCFSLYPCRFAAWLPLRICCGCKKKTDCSSCRPAKKKAGPRPYFFFVRPSSAAAMSVQGVEPGEMQLPPSSLCRMKILHPGKQQTKSAATTEDACRGPTPANFSTEVGAHRAAECLVGLKQEEHIQEFYHIPPPLREVRVCGTVKGAEGYGQTFRIPRPT